MGEQTVALNRKARHEFSIEDTLEAGIVLTGTEIKSIRAGKVSLQEAYARIDRGEAWLVGAHIAPYATGNRWNHEAKRTRKLLLHKDEIHELLGRTKSKGLTLIPLRLYIDDRGHAKLQIGLGARQAAPRPAPRHRRAGLAARGRARALRRAPRPLAPRARGTMGVRRQRAGAERPRGRSDQWGCVVSTGPRSPGTRAEDAALASSTRRQTEVPANKQPALAYAA